MDRASNLNGITSIGFDESAMPIDEVAVNKHLNSQLRASVETVTLRKLTELMPSQVGCFLNENQLLENDVDPDALVKLAATPRTYGELLLMATDQSSCSYNIRRGRVEITANSDNSFYVFDVTPILQARDSTKAPSRSDFTELITVIQNTIPDRWDEGTDTIEPFIAPSTPAGRMLLIVSAPRETQRLIQKLLETICNMSRLSPNSGRQHASSLFLQDRPSN